MARLKAFSCECCGQITGPMEITARFPDGWVRAQVKRYGCWDDIIYACPDCSGRIVSAIVAFRHDKKPVESFVRPIGRCIISENPSQVIEACCKRFRDFPKESIDINDATGERWCRWCNTLIEIKSQDN